MAPGASLAWWPSWLLATSWRGPLRSLDARHPVIRHWRACCPWMPRSGPRRIPGPVAVLAAGDFVARPVA